jgi:hypothetical protein
MPVADASMAVLGSHGRHLILLISLVIAVRMIDATFFITREIADAVRSR